ncbi:MAG: hypothetical protein CVU50_08125 [Candidatus Cloacimonetes bacterium HGW-Cloacimonetes-3]|jgi:tetratricopeptide (TPR) repeat protein|nr:MAG: hypothetical protein CVU50_08125 [Candidatus Cloacimonetes bacterium HGW-Cloacimonetes-3]
MNRLILIISVCFISIHLGAAQVGKIRFILGEVQYRANQNQPYKFASLGLPISEDGFLKTGPDSSVEVQWSEGGTSTVPANRQVGVRKLLDEASSKQNWKNKLENKVGNLKLQNKRRASSTAGIRREEADVSRDSLLFWYIEELQEISEAISLYETKQYTKAIPLFEKVINQAPLKKDAELSHAYLILIYDSLGDVVKLKKHVTLLKQDFPESTTLDSLPTDK